MGHELEDLNTSALCPSFVPLLGRGRLLALGKVSKRFVCLLLSPIYIPSLKSSVHYALYETKGLFAWCLLMPAYGACVFAFQLLSHPFALRSTRLKG